jgi:hypothetical protein
MQPDEVPAPRVGKPKPEELLRQSLARYDSTRRRYTRRFDEYTRRWKAEKREGDLAHSGLFSLVSLGISGRICCNFKTRLDQPTVAPVHPTRTMHLVRPWVYGRGRHMVPGTNPGVFRSCPRRPRPIRCLS